MSDDYIDLLDRSAAPQRPGFAEELLAELVAELHTPGDSIQPIRSAGPVRPHAGRRLYAVLGAAAAVVALVAVAAVALREDPDQIVGVPGETPPASVPDSVAPTPPPVTTTPATAPATDPPSTAPASTPATTGDAPSTTSVPVASGVGWTRPCTASTEGAGRPRPADDPSLGRFGPLASAPSLQLELPMWQPEDGSPAVPAASGLVRIPGGVLVSLRAPSSTSSMLAAVDHDGTRRWVRCDDTGIGAMWAAPSASAANVAIVSYWGNDASGAPGDMRLISLDDGADMGSLADHLATAGIDLGAPMRSWPLAESDTSILVGPDEATMIDPAVHAMARVDLATLEAERIPFPSETAGGEQFAFDISFTGAGDLVMMAGATEDQQVALAVYRDGSWSTDEATLLAAVPIRVIETQEGLTGIDALGGEVWRRSDILPLNREGFHLETDGAMTLVVFCSAGRTEFDCDEESMVGLETATGVERWRAPFVSAAVVTDGHALVLTWPGRPDLDLSPGWRLIDTATGELVDDSQQWSDPGTFGTSCCGEDEYVWTDHDGGVVFATDPDRAAVYFPAAATPSDGPATLTLP